MAEAIPTKPNASLPPAGGRSLRKLLANRVALVALGFLALMAIGAMVGPMLLPESYRYPSEAQYQSPSWQHPFGTDLNGRDLLYRVLQGARVSLLVGLCGALISLVVGTAYGMIAAFAGGRVDSAMMRFVDVLYAVPRLIFILIFINAFDGPFKSFLDQNFAGGPLEWTVGYSKILILIFSLGLIEWLTMARIVRGQVLVLKKQPFILAARALGQSRLRILSRHLFPNVVGIMLTYLTLAIPAVVLDESFLSFLGLGVDAPLSSWGSLLHEGAAAINPIRIYWWLLLFPAMFMSLTLLALNFLGDGLRDAFDPRDR